MIKLILILIFAVVLMINSNKIRNNFRNGETNRINLWITTGFNLFIIIMSIVVMAVCFKSAEMNDIKSIAREMGKELSFYTTSDEKGSIESHKKYWYQPYRLIRFKDGTQIVVKYKSWFLGEIGGYDIVNKNGLTNL